jgi:centrosomal protein CEP120
MEKIVIHLCHELKVLAHAHVPLKLTVGSGISVIEQVYVLTSTTDSFVYPGGNRPGIGLSMALSADVESQEQHVDNTTHVFVEDAPAPAVETKPVITENPAPSPRHIRPITHVSPEPKPKPPKVKAYSHAWHQFRFSIELRSLRDSAITSANAFFKYRYPPFGISSPVVTHPVQHIVKVAQEQLLPHSFTAFEFVMTETQLSECVRDMPLRVEMWHLDEYTKNVLLGTATIDLSQVLYAPKSDQTEGQPMKIQSLDSMAVVAPLSSSFPSRLGNLRVILALEDFGPVEDYQGEKEFVPTMHTHVPSSMHTHVPPAPHMYPPSVAETNLHETQEYKVAMDLEIWKQEEETKFLASLAEREQELVRKLTAEWKARELAREETLKGKLEYYKTLELSLENMSTQLEQREHALVEAEGLFEERRQAHELECQRAITEARDTSRRLADDFAHKLSLERAHTIDAKESANKYQREVEVVSGRYKALETEFFEVRKQTHSGDAMAVSTQLAAALVKNTELTQTLESRNVKLASTKSKLAKLHQAYTVLKAAAKKEQENKEKRQGKEILGLQQRLAAAAELNTLKQDENKLKDVRTAMQELKENMAPKVVPPENARQVEHLKRERENLLQTGIYNVSDGLICEIDARIAGLTA